MNVLSRKLPRMPLQRLRWLATALCLWAGAAGAAIYSGNATNPSTSTPKLNAAGTAWEPFSNAQGVPNSGKSIKVLYVSDDGAFAAFPLNAAAATVTLRPRTAGPEVICEFDPAPPVLTASNAGTCWFRMTSTAGQPGDTLEVFYLGLLTGNIRYTASGLTPVVGGHTVTPFNSDRPLPLLLPSAQPPPPAPATGPPLSRKPARLVLVFDKSGSMDWSAKPSDATCGTLRNPTPACKRWEILKYAAAQMVHVAKAYALPGDRLGLVFFDQVATDTGAIAAMNNLTLDAVSTALGSRAPGGNTSIGAGVERLKAGQLASNASFNNMTLLFTDGEQNTAPFLVSDGVQLLINPTQNSPAGTAWVAAPNTVGLCTFMLRADDPAGAAGTTTLQQMADRACTGLMHSSATLNVQPSELITFFLLVLNKTLIGDKLELIQSSQGTQPFNGTPPPAPVPMTFVTSKQDLSFTMLLSWDSGFQADGSPGLSLVKDGVTFNVLQDPGVLQSGSGQSVALTLRQPFCNAAGQCVKPDGTWTLTATRTLPRGPGSWGLFVIGDNATLASDFSVTQPTAGIGQPLQFRATLTEGGAPLAGLAAGSVRAFVQAPSAGLGNVLAASSTGAGQAAEGDALSAAGRKVQAMLADPAQRAQILAALELGAEQGIPLAETAPGVYSASFPATVVEGIYRVSFRVAGNNAANGDFTRIFNTDRYVAVQPDDAATARTMTVSKFTPCDARFAGGCLQIRLRPVDAAGNFVGPGKGTAIAPRAPFAGEVIGSVVDLLDGAYTLVLGYTASSATAPVLSVGGLPLNLPASASPRGSTAASGGILRWWWLLLLLLLALIVVAWLRWR